MADKVMFCLPFAVCWWVYVGGVLSSVIIGKTFIVLL